MGTLWYHCYLLNFLLFVYTTGNETSYSSDVVEAKPPAHLLFEIIPDRKPRFLYGSLHTLNRLANLSQKEEQLVAVLGKRLELVENEIKLISSYLEDYQESTRKAMEGLVDPTQNNPEGRGKVIGSSAVLAHRMTCRYTSILEKLQGLLSSETYLENQQNVDEFLELKHFKELRKLEESEMLEIFNPPLINFGKMGVNPNVDKSSMKQKEAQELPMWPKWMDKYMSDLSFIHIHEIYGYNPADICVGLDIDTKHGSSLNAKQCAEIGALALSRQCFYVSIEWLEQAKSLLLLKNSKDTSVPVDLVSSLLNIAIKEVHNIGMENETVSDYMDFYINPTYESESKKDRLRMRRYVYSNPDGKNDEDIESMTRFWGLCSGATFQTPQEQSTLKCFYDTKKHPYLYINPLKTEVLSESPPVVQFYDVLSNETMEKIKAVAAPRLQLSQIVGTIDMEMVTKHRTSAGTYLLYQDVPKLYDHSEIVSGLKLKLASEMGQVVEYTYGRYYNYHTDAFEDEEETLEQMEEVGDRVATLLYYIEIAEFGGNTPFCAAGVNARPVRGSAILWYNLYRNGTVRQDVDHGACPVVHGHKMSKTIS
ncbi:Prolyl 4-hydroxylase subunit alpha-2 [Orchesella cincta]|uniref:Prolyl 4-hydroxylase subunit alpha-2 n=1 Tax=Orchesella cincta TaxID=48709 RepID=A0A1D2MQN4_ORCCI|nr:Prolyl 4-hydroxylase subunit alpha-2 [Orchesella cincta]